MRKFSEIIDIIKKNKGVTEDQEVGSILGVTKQHLSKIQKEDKIPYKAIAEYCIRENTSFDYLVGLTDETNPKNPDCDLCTLKDRLIENQTELIEMQKQKISDLQSKLPNKETKVA